MKALDQYKSLSDFTTDLEAHPEHHIPFKIMGQKKAASPPKSKAVFYSASMLGFVYKNITDPDLSGAAMPVDTLFGQIFNRGCELYGSRTF